MSVCAVVPTRLMKVFPLHVVSLTVTFPLTFNKPGPLIALMLAAGMFSVSLTFKCCVSVSV